MINSDRKLGIAPCVDEVSSAKLRQTLFSDKES